jgi:hypothetical protein
MYKILREENKSIIGDEILPACYQNLEMGSVFLADENNKDYQQYLIWLEEGNEPLPADPLPEPQELTVQEKLQAAGLTIEELKEALGL